MSLSCFEFVDKKSQLTLEEAQQLLLDEARLWHQQQDRVHRLPLQQALGAHLAASLSAPQAVPPHTNSAMDGYALVGASLVSQTQWQLVGTQLAGQMTSHHLQPGEAMAITTGAALPPGADTVVMQEQCHVEGDQLTIQRAAEIRIGANVRQAGEDLQQGQQVLAAGARLGPVQLGLLASLGCADVPVRPALKVAVFSTGDEVVAAGQPLAPGQIYDTNRTSLISLLQALGCQVSDLGILPDDQQVIHQALAQAALTHQLVITSGGVSVGQADWIKPVLNQLGETRFWQLAIRPGRPFAFGHLGQNASGETCFFAGLPGNPVAVMVTFMLLVQPLILALQGAEAGAATPVHAQAEEEIKSRLGRSDFYRARLSTSPTGQLSVRVVGEQGSGRLSSMHEANCLVRLDEQEALKARGDSVRVYPFAGFLAGYLA